MASESAQNLINEAESRTRLIIPKGLVDDLEAIIGYNASTVREKQVRLAAVSSILEEYDMQYTGKKAIYVIIKDCFGMNYWTDFHKYTQYKKKAGKV